MKVICENCKNEIEVEPYVYNERVVGIFNTITTKEHYVASADIRFFCNLCGTVHNYKNVSKELSDAEIDAIVKGIIPFYIEGRLYDKKEQNNETN